MKQANGVLDGSDGSVGRSWNIGGIINLSRPLLNTAIIHIVIWQPQQGKRHDIAGAGMARSHS